MAFTWTNTFIADDEITSVQIKETKDNIDTLQAALVCITHNVDDRTSELTLNNTTNDSGDDTAYDVAHHSNLYTTNCPTAKETYYGTKDISYHPTYYVSVKNPHNSYYLSSHNTSQKSSFNYTV